MTEAHFDQLARAKGGVADVTVQRGACGGCFNSLPPQFVNEVRKTEKLNYCESCGRIIISLDPPRPGAMRRLRESHRWVCGFLPNGVPASPD